MILDAPSLFMALLSEQGMELIDEQGRPLGERAIWAAYQSAEVDERPCPFHDRRQEADLPINAAALRQVIQCWPELLLMLNALTGAWPTSSSHLSGFEVWRVNVAAQCWPLWERFFAPGADARVALPLSALFKVTLGFSSFLPMAMLSHEGLADAPMLEALDGEACYALLDREEWLWGVHQVCAGPPRHIIAFYEQLCSHDAAAALPARTPPPSLLAMTEIAQELQVALLAAGLGAQSFIRRNLLAECPGFGAPTTPELIASWPYCMRILELCPSRTLRVVGAMPELRVRLTRRLYPGEHPPEGLLERLEQLKHAESLAAVDELLLSWLDQLATTATRRLALPPAARQLTAALDDCLRALAQELGSV